MDNINGERIQHLTHMFELYPFLGMLLRMYVANPDVTDDQIFQNTLNSYKTEVTRFSKSEIEQAFNMFCSIDSSSREAYLVLYKIINYGIS